jgi:hypothetical protein
MKTYQRKYSKHSEYCSIIQTNKKNFIGPALVGFAHFFFFFFFVFVFVCEVLLSIVSHKFSTSCDSRGFKHGWIKVCPML